MVSYDAVKQKLRFSKFSFELVGYDFMVIPCKTGSSDADYRMPAN